MAAGTSPSWNGESQLQLFQEYNLLTTEVYFQKGNTSKEGKKFIVGRSHDITKSQNPCQARELHITPSVRMESCSFTTQGNSIVSENIDCDCLLLTSLPKPDSL